MFISKQLTIWGRLIINEYDSIEKILNNRELAIFIWLLVILLIGLSLSKFRGSIVALIKVLFEKVFIKMVVRVLVYSILVIFCLDLFGFWEVGLLKAFLKWFFIVALVTSFRSFNKIKDISYFKDTLFDNIKVTVFVQFVTNMYSYGLIVEFLLFPLIIVISIFEIPDEMDSKVTNVINGLSKLIISVIGILYLVNSIRLTITNFDHINVQFSTKEFFLPIVLSMMLVIFNYFYVVVAQYEILFIRLSCKKAIKDKYRWYFKGRVILYCKLNLTRIRTFMNRSNIVTVYVESYQDVKRIIDNEKNHEVYKKPILKRII